MIRLALCMLVLLGSALSAGRALARVERFAVVIGNNVGAEAETPLAYAESDAQRVYDVLHELGGFAAVNMVLLRAERADVVRSTLIALNDRIRHAMSTPDTQAMLLVYYSGHADEDALHLSGTRFDISELAQLTRGSSANVRLVVLDACRSGSLTRTKGGKIVAPFALEDDTLPSDGLAFLTASSAHEDAQESDELRGSFFTHAFVSGLLGAADHDGDGAVVLDEAYRYAYEGTLRATSRTLAGTQHPTFRYDLRGQGELVLTRPEAHAGERAQVSFPSDVSVLLMREHAHGAVVAELMSRASQRAISVRPGRYFVRARGRDVLYEGALDFAAGASHAIALDSLERVQYARLVRKGERASAVAHGLELGARVRTALPNADTACIGAMLGYSLDFEALGLALRASGCSSGLDNMSVMATTNGYDVELRAYRAWDAGDFVFSVGLGGGGALFTQSFETRGLAPDRSSFAPFLGVHATLGYDLGAGYHADVDLAAETYFLRVQDSASEAPHAVVGFALRPSFVFGKRF